MSDLLYELKPKYDYNVRTPFSLFWAFLGSLLVAYILIIVYLFTEQTESLPYIVAYIAGFLICLLIVMFIDRKNYEETSYKIYDDKLEFEEGFINHRYITIRIKDIKEIYFSQGFNQRYYGVGTIRFATGVNTFLWFSDIENPNEIYTKIKELYEKNNTNNPNEI